ncbi:MAG TPA: hypothetical protein PKA62_10235 [Thermoanaerobaculia bacterium]|nr:hypothetical protein [Thermoanaerobaculia bacterium]
MTASARRLAAGAALLALLLAGAALRLYRVREAPPGPWIDEALALRAARIASATGAPLLGTSPLQPPDAGFVNSWVTNLSLYGLSAIDRAAGGGIASVRAMSVLPALVLLAGIAALAAAAAAGRPFPLLLAAFLGGTSAWLLVTGRWGWNAVATSAVVVLAAALALLAASRRSAPLGAVAGALAGLAGWGYVAAWAILPLPPALWLLGRHRERRAAAGDAGDAAAFRRVATAGLVACGLVLAPLAAHYAAHPERAIARARELSAARDGTRSALPGLARNAAAYARLFTFGGDPNERHGDPGRPVLPLAVTGLALVGVASGLRRGGPERFLAASAGLFLLASLLAVEEAANAYRAVHAAPFLVVLAALGAERLVGLAGGRRRLATAAVVTVVAVAGLTDAGAFLRWLGSPRLEGAFGGPERALADAIRDDLGVRGPADVVLAPAAARNAFVVDALLARPGTGRPAIRLADGLGSLRYRPSRDLLLAESAASSRPVPAGSLAVATGGVLPGFPGWRLLRVPAGAAAAAAAASLGALPLLPAPGRGGLLVAEEGLYTFSSRGGLEARLDGGLLFGEARPAGSLTVRLSPGRHEVRTRLLRPGARLRIVGPDGFVLPAP